MKKLCCKLIAVFSVMLLLLGAMGTVTSADASKTSELVSGLLKVDRDLVIPALPFLSSDSGLDMLDDALRDHRNGKNDSILGSVVLKALQYTDEATLQNGVDTLRVLDESFRQKCQSIYQNYNELSLSAAEAKGAEALVSLMNKKDSRVQTVLSKHQISNGMLASFLEAASLLNTAPLFAMNAAGEFYINSYPMSQIQAIDAIWQADGMEMDTRQMLVDGTTALNTVLSASEKTNVAYLLKKTGLLDRVQVPQIPEKDVPKLPGGGAGAIKDGENDKPGEKAFEVTEGGLVSINGAFTNPVVYRVVGADLVPVKMSLYADGVILAELETGQYVVKEATPYFTDCNGWSKPYIEALYARGIIGGKGDRNFAPEDKITREEFVKLVIELFDLVDSEAVTSFTDVSEDAWYYRCVASAQQYGIVGGISETKFGVGQLIRRQDMAKIISDLLRKKGLAMKEADKAQIKDFSSIHDYAKNHVLSAYGMGIISGDDMGNFNPHYFATRGESAKMIFGMIQAVLKR